MFDVDSIMSTKLVTIPRTSSIAEARTLMHENRIHHLPVVDGKLRGIITDTDFVGVAINLPEQLEAS